MGSLERDLATLFSSGTALPESLWRPSGRAITRVLTITPLLYNRGDQDSTRSKNSLGVTQEGVKLAQNLTGQMSKPRSAAQQHMRPLEKCCLGHQMKQNSERTGTAVL